MLDRETSQGDPSKPVLPFVQKISMISVAEVIELRDRRVADSISVELCKMNIICYCLGRSETSNKGPTRSGGMGRNDDDHPPGPRQYLDTSNYSIKYV